MPRSLLIFFALAAALLFSCKKHFTASTTPSPGASVTKNFQSDYRNDSLWWGVWRQDSAFQNGESFRTAPMYYYFLPDKRCFVLAYLRDSISDFNEYKNKHDFFVRNDSVFTTDVLPVSSGNVITGNLLFTFDSTAAGKTKVVFPNGNMAWMSQILLAKKGSNCFFKIE